MLSKRVEEN